MHINPWDSARYRDNTTKPPSMAQNHIPQTEITKINIECPKSQKKLKRFLSNLQGNYSVKFDPESGRLTVESTVDKNMINEAVGHARFSAGLTCEDNTLPPPDSNFLQPKATGSHMSDGAQDQGLEIIRWAQMGELQKLPNIQRLQKLELTQSGSNQRIKLTFFDEKPEPQPQPQPEPQPQPQPQAHARVNVINVKDDEQNEPHGGGSGANSRPANEVCGDHEGGEGRSCTSSDGGSHHNLFEFQYVHTPPEAAGNNNDDDVQHAEVRCEEAIASRCTIL
ncbi:uncharacterized protein LOC126617219 [Malus sylvestris]|uniref:uncharacterized protein LOC126617219 n=1 Tax=Malus sylvestris TaxID=3752 RepID=UPI0021AB9C39|nr:uncharacterized protein LOC126617219 [Malus sylvestris]